MGNGGIIVPDNLHPAIKESLNVYLGNAGLGAQGGATAQFGLGSSVQSVNARSSQQENSRRLPTGRIGSQGSSVEELTSGIRLQSANALRIANLGNVTSREALDQATQAQIEGTETRQLANQSLDIANDASEIAEEFEGTLQATVSDFENSTANFVTTDYFNTQINTAIDTRISELTSDDDTVL